MLDINQKKEISEADFFNLIRENKTDELSKIIESNPDLIDAVDNETKLGAIFFAIKFNKIDCLKLLLKMEESLLDSKNKENHNPIFYAISEENAEAVKAILEIDLGELNRDHETDNINPLIFAVSNSKPMSLEVLLSFCKDIDLSMQLNSENDENIFFKAIKKYFEFEYDQINRKPLIILNQLYKKIFDSDTELTKNQCDNIKVYFENFMLINLSVIGDLGTKEVFLRKLLGKQIFQSDSSDNFLQSLQSEINPIINNIKKPFLAKDRRLYIFDSDLTDHSSFFIFHTDLDNKIEAISYIDGNQDFSNQSSDGYVYGAKTFRLKEKINFDHDLLEDFMDQTNKKNADYLRQNLLNFEIYGQKLGDLTQEESVLTRNQKRGNCTFKSYMLLLKFLAEKRIGDGSQEIIENEYKEFKTQIKIQAFKNLHKLKDSLDSESALDNFLAKQIDDILIKSKVRLFEKTEAKTSDNELRILKAIDGSASPRVGQKRIIADDLSTPISKKHLFMDSFDSDNFISPQTEIKTQIGVAQHQKLIQNDTTSTVLRF